VVDHLVYDAFGQITSQTAPGSQPRFAYDGDQLDSTSGLYDDGSQWYDPAAGVYVSDNPRGLAAGDTNLSRFCGNSPPNRADLGGLGLNGSSQSAAHAREAVGVKTGGGQSTACRSLGQRSLGCDSGGSGGSGGSSSGGGSSGGSGGSGGSSSGGSGGSGGSVPSWTIPVWSEGGWTVPCMYPTGANLPDGGYGEANLGGGYLGGDGYLVGLASGVVFVGSGVDNNSPRMLGSAAMPPLAPGMITGGTYPGFPPFDVRVDPGSLFPEGGGGPGISSADNNGNTGRGSTLRGPVPVPPTPSADNNGNSGRSSTLPGPIPAPPTRP